MEIMMKKDLDSTEIIFIKYMLCIILYFVIFSTAVVCIQNDYTQSSYNQNDYTQSSYNQNDYTHRSTTIKKIDFLGIHIEYN